jgi:hypothetical protein
MANPDNSSLRSTLLDQVREFRRSNLNVAKSRKAYSELAEKYANLAIATSANNTHQNLGLPHLERLFDFAAKGRGNFRRAINDSLWVAWVLLSLHGKPGFSLGALTNLADANREISLRQREVSAALRDDPDVHRTRGAKFPILSIVKSFLLLSWNIQRDILLLPDYLRQWVGKNFEFFFVQPLYRELPAKQKCPLGIRVTPGSNDAHRQLPGLFSTTPCEGSMCVDCRELLIRAFGSLKRKKNLAASGWLANRIAQTNEMVAALHNDHGLKEVFRLQDLLTRIKSGAPSKKHLSAMLRSLDARLILRCILEEGGNILLSEWCDDLERRARAAIQSWAEDNKTGSFDRLDQYFGFFSDRTGLVAAAIEALQQQQSSGRENDPTWQVYFRLDRVRNLFRLPASQTTRGTYSLLDTDQCVHPEEFCSDFGASVLTGDVNIDATVELFLEWESQEGAKRNETAEDLLQDFIKELEHVGNYGEIERDNVMRIREALSQRSS